MHGHDAGPARNAVPGYESGETSATTVERDGRSDVFADLVAVEDHRYQRLPPALGLSSFRLDDLRRHFDVGQCE